MLRPRMLLLVVLAQALAASPISIPPTIYPHIFELPDGRVVLAGGIAPDPKGFVRAQTVVLDLHTRRVELAPAPFGNLQPDALLSTGGRVVAVGRDEAGAAHLRWLDVDTLSWREAAAPPCDTLRASWLVEGNGDVIFVGGSRVPNEYITPLTTVARWSPTTDTWAKLADLGTARASPTLLPGRAGVVACGGFAGPGEDDPTSCEALRGGRWELVEPPIEELGPVVTVPGPRGTTVFRTNAIERITGAWHVAANGRAVQVPAPAARVYDASVLPDGRLLLVDLGRSALVVFDPVTGASELYELGAEHLTSKTVAALHDGTVILLSEGEKDVEVRLLPPSTLSQKRGAPAPKKTRTP